MTDPTPTLAPAGPRRWRIIGKVAWAGVWVYLLVQLAPHLAAVIGIETQADLSPRFSFIGLNSDPIASEDLKGRVVLVNFWATWCVPCRVEMPLLQQMADRHREAGLVVVGLSRDAGPTAAVAEFLQERSVTYPVAVVGADAERVFGGVRGYPTSFLLDRSGRIRQKALGPLAMLSFEPAVRRLLNEP